jgi:hypothetical protein
MIGQGIDTSRKDNRADTRAAKAKLIVTLWAFYKLLAENDTSKLPHSVSLLLRETFAPPLPIRHLSDTRRALASHQFDIANHDVQAAVTHCIRSRPTPI